jgi:hypothetical protein
MPTKTIGMEVVTRIAALVAGAVAITITPRVESHKLLHERGEPVTLALPKSRFNGDGLSLQIPTITQRLLD